MAQIEKTNQIDQYLEQIDKKQDSSNKKRIILVAALLLLSCVAVFSYNQFAGKETLADSGTDSGVIASSDLNATSLTVAENENDITDDELLAELEAEEAAAAAALDEENEDETEAEAEAEEKKKVEEDEPKAKKQEEETKPKNVNQPAPSSGVGVSNASFTADQLSNVPAAKTFKTNNNSSSSSSTPKKATPAKETAKADVVTEKGGTEEVVEAPVKEKVEDVKPSEPAVEAPAPPVAEKAAAPTGITRKPSYPGGEGKMRQFFARKINYPNKAINKKVEGSVQVRIKVDEAGKIVDSQVVDGIGAGCDREVLKAISKMPDWEPAMENGVAVPKYYLLSVAFRLPK